MGSVTGKATDLITFSRASLATVTDSDGKLKWAPHNLLLASEQFDSASWTKSAATVSANVAATTAPNGTSTADKLAEDATTAAHRIQQGFNATIGATYTISIYAKAAERNWLQFLTNSFSGGNQAANFNLSNGTIGSGATGANLTKTITSVGSGWYLCTVTWTPDATGSNVYFYVMDSDAATGASYAGVAGNGVYLWGAHLYRSDLGGMQANTSAYPMYNPTTPKNLLGFSDQFSNSYWNKVQITIAANTALAPNGLQTADKLVPTSGTSGGQIYNTPVAIISGGVYTASAYVKAGELGFAFVALNARASSTTQGVCVNLSTGAVSNQGASATYTVTSVGDGWWRVSCTGTANFTSGYLEVWPLASAGLPNSYTGDGTSGIYLWGAQLSDSASLDTYTRNNFAAPSAAAYYGPRLDYDPSTLAAKGLLVEEQRTNMFLYSDQFDNNTHWTKDGLVTAGMANAAVGPTGTSVADAITEDNTTGLHRIYGAVTLAAGTYTMSFYAKANGRQWLYFYLDTGIITGYLNFTTNTYVPVNGSATVSSVPVGNSWYRVAITYVNTNTSSQSVQIWLATNSTTNSYAGDNTSGIYLYGAQLEAGSFATSYIPTGSASATRSADVASVSTQAFPYSASEGTIVVAWQLAQLSGSPAAIHLTDDAENNRIRINAHLAGINRSTITAAGSLVANIDTSTAATGVTKYALGGKSADYAVYRNGSAGGTSTNSGFPSGCTELRIGRDGATGNFNGHIRQITYIPRRLTNAELQSRTA